MSNIYEACPRCENEIVLSVNLFNPDDKNELRQRAAQRCGCDERQSKAVQ